ncbi:cupin domain-containing protein [Gemmobacter sp. 24YEA27]|uniref:cupin domain-containing protein n=1 Tax=Gemmobacter sp. 24YEA27 TaxID=3040672 RepID=UPI0024B3887B|nr:cupin domain-containing protein [Gemmobacter sp. 24YEA27]
MLDRSPNATLPMAGTSTPDMMSELLMGMRLNGISYRRMQLSAPFGIGFGGAPGKAQLHFVARGEAWLVIDGTPRHIGCGDAVFLPRGTGHALVSQPGRRCATLPISPARRSVTRWMRSKAAIRRPAAARM